MYVPPNWLADTLLKHATTVLTDITSQTAYLAAQDAVAVGLVGGHRGLPAGMRYAIGAVNGNYRGRQRLCFYTGVQFPGGRHVPLYRRKHDKNTLVGHLPHVIRAKIERLIREQVCTAEELSRVSDRWHRLLRPGRVEDRVFLHAGLGNSLSWSRVGRAWRNFELLANADTPELKKLAGTPAGAAVCFAEENGWQHPVHQMAGAYHFNLMLVKGGVK